MSSDSSIVFAVQSAVLEVFEAIESYAKTDSPDKEQAFKDEAQKTVLMFIAAIILAGKNYNPAQRSFLSLLVNCEDLPGGEPRYLNEYATRWISASRIVPDFFEAAVRYDANHQTETARGILRQIQLIGNNACASDGCIRPSENQVVQDYVKFLDAKIEAVTTPRPVAEEVPPILAVSQQPIYAPIQPERFNYRRNTELRWVAPSESIEIHGYQLPAGMIYVSDGDPRTAEASAINLGLPIGKPELGEHTPLNYYPQYNYLSPDQRAAYLKWLAGGRKDVDPASRELGYIFLFLYGLERRLLVDHGQEQEVVAEIVRLLHDYGTFTRSRSLQSYAGQLVHFWGWKQGQEYYSQLLEWMKTLPVSLLGADEMAMVLASQFQSKSPLPPELAFEVAARDFNSRRSVVVTRVKEEFKELFAKRYQEKFPEGVKLDSASRNTRLYYRAASPTLLYNGRQDLSISIPDVLGLSSQFKPLVNIWNSCVDDLAGYSRARSKSGPTAKNLKAYFALPDELRATTANPLAKEWETLLNRGRSGSNCRLLDVGSVANLLGTAQREKLTMVQSEELAQTVESLGYVIEPDARHEASYAWDQEIAVFKPVDGKVTVPSKNYLGASVLLKLCVLVAGADGHIAPEELEVSRRFVETKLTLTPGDLSRLEALEQILIADPDRISGSLARIAKPVPAPMRELICEVLVYVAAADNIVTKDEIRVLERIFKAFELPSEKLDGYLKSVSPEFGEVTIQRAGDRISGEAIPRPGQPFHIDMSRVDRIAQETSELVGILAKVMTDEEPEIQKPTRKEKTVRTEEVKIASEVTTSKNSTPLPDWIKSLDAKYQPVLLGLLKQDTWPRSEFEALAKKSQLMPLDAFDAINGWADENLGDFLLDGEDTILIHKQLIP